MKSVTRFVISLSFLLYFLQAGYSQQVAIGQFRDELPYNQVISVTEGEDRIYCATPYSVFYFNKTDSSLVRLTKINGLSDIGISNINYNKDLKTLVIAYANANIDLLKGNTIINISDIKRKAILGNKTINRVNFIGQYAYLSCGFGIVVLDVDKEEIHDTYYIGNEGSHVNVLGLVKNDQDTLFAVTEKGIYKAWYNDPNLVNFASWKKEIRMDTNALYKSIAFFAGNVIVTKANSPIPTNNTADTLYRFSNSQWSRWTLDVHDLVTNLEANYHNLTISYIFSLDVFNNDFNQLTHIWSYFPGTPVPLDGIMDKDSISWFGDYYSGLISHNNRTDQYKHYNLSGPITARVFSMTTTGDDLYIAPGGRDNSFVPGYYPGQIYHFNTVGWANLDAGNTPGLANVDDIVTIVVDPSNSKHIFAGSWGNGLLEFSDGAFVKRYDQGNSTLEHHSGTTDTNVIRVGGAAYDHDGNLWVVCTRTNKCLSKKTGDNWTGYNISINNESDLGQMIIDRNNQKWILMRYENSNPNSILVVSADGTQAVKLNSSTGSGAIPGNIVFAMAEDLTGEIWVGTEKGIGVFYCPESIFSGGCDAQQILVQQGSYTQYLLENETVTAIAVDGGNNKWIGTDRGGIYEFTPDAKQLNHFTEDDSPLFSNRITSIAISQSGEVFIGTDKGVISYRGTATIPGQNETAYAFPNPVKKGYSGWIGIKGLVSDASVKITDINGVLVYATKAEGGQAIWDGKNFSGKKADAGVYLVFASTSTGTEKVVTKILILQ
ncbi:MAG: hypothetical protein NTX61_01295 [Bacteroidetes bacterium]|nr:hypothetical protein [Bacteroidota bacterium]